MTTKLLGRWRILPHPPPPHPESFHSKNASLHTTVLYTLCLAKITSARFTQFFFSCPTQDPKLSSRKNVVPGKYFQARVGRKDLDNSPAVHLSPASCSSWPSSQNSESRLVITPHLFFQQVIGSVSTNEKGSCPPTVFKQLAIKFSASVRNGNFLPQNPDST